MTTFKADSVVTHRGGLWFALSDADGEPGVDPAWQLMVQGVDSSAPTYSLTQVWKGVYQGPTGSHGVLYEPTASEGFELGSLPAWVTASGSVLANYHSSDWGSGAAGSLCVLVYTSSAGAVSRMSFDVQSTGDTQVDILSAWGLSADGTGTIALDGTTIATRTGAGANSAYAHTTFTVPAGTHTVTLTTTDGGSGNQNVIAVDTISLTGTTPAGLSAGYNDAGPGADGAPYSPGDLVTLQGDLYLALMDVTDISPSSGYPYWAKLSTHATSGGSSLPTPGADGNLLTAQSSTWISAPPAGDDAPDLTLIFENGLI